MTQASLFGEPRRMVATPAEEFPLYPYQRRAANKIKERLGEDRSTLYVAPTGTGKTRVGTAVIREWDGPVLWLAHRDELIDQAIRDLRRHTGRDVGKEKAEDRASAASIVVGSVQTLKGPRLEDFAGRCQPTLVVVDEAHHAVAPSYKAILARFGESKVLGLTATPDRADELAMGQVFESVADVYEIHDAIRDGYLCKFRPARVLVKGIELANVGTVAGDFNQGELDAIMALEEVLHGIVKPLLERAEGRRTLVFTTSVANAHRMAEIFNRYRPECAAAVDGKTPTDERRRILGDHQDGRFQYLVNVGIATEGYDDPAISCIGMGRPTKSRALYAQMLGRGLRIFPGKVDCLAIDFVGNHGRHELVSSLDILDGRYDDETVRRAKKIAERDDSIDASEALELAAGELDEERKREAARRAAIKTKVTYGYQELSPFDLMHVKRDDNADAEAVRFGQLGGSEKQVAWAKKLGIKEPEKLPRPALKRLLNAASVRLNLGLASPGQLRVLQRAGINKINISFARASSIIDELKNNRWHLPPARIDELMVRQPGEEG